MRGHEDESTRGPGGAVAHAGTAAGAGAWYHDRSRLGPGPCADCGWDRGTADAGGERVCVGCLWCRVQQAPRGSPPLAVAQRVLASVGFLSATPHGPGDPSPAPGAITVYLPDGWPLGELWRGSIVEALLAPPPPPEPPAGDEPAEPLVVGIPWLPAGYGGKLLVWRLTVWGPAPDGPRAVFRWHPSGGWGPADVVRLGCRSADWQVAQRLRRLGPGATKVGRRQGTTTWPREEYRAAYRAASAALWAGNRRPPTDLELANEIGVSKATLYRYRGQGWEPEPLLAGKGRANN